MSQTNRYSQSRALLAITKASFKAIFANPSAIIFSVLFPIIFILIFGAFDNGGNASFRIALTPDSDTTSEFYQGLVQTPVIKLMHYDDSAQLQKELQKGKLTAVLKIYRVTDNPGSPDSTVSSRVVIHSTTASGNTLGSFLPVLDYIRLRIEQANQDSASASIQIDPPIISEVRKYRQIDFILPGQLGFSILFSTLFGIAFTFFGLREQLVLKRFYATPIHRLNILLGIGASRLSFQLLSVTVLLLFGHFAMDFKLHAGAITFFEIIFMTLLMLFLLMGVGLIFSSIVKADTSIPLLINLFGFPQMMLSGTFFPIDVFPGWLQQFCQILPLTQFNDAIRKLAFEGVSIWGCWPELLTLGGWMVIIYFIAARTIKWE
ncbi:MAG: ABC transporter permease [Bacteroidota bacterium]